VIENLKREIRECILKKVEELTDEEMEALTSAINLIFHGVYKKTALALESRTSQFLPWLSTINTMVHATQQII